MSSPWHGNLGEDLSQQYVLNDCRWQPGRYKLTDREEFIAIVDTVPGRAAAIMFLTRGSWEEEGAALRPRLAKEKSSCCRAFLSYRTLHLATTS